MNRPRSIAANMRDLAAAHIGIKPLWFVFLLLSTRLLGAAEFGRAMLAISFVSILAALFEGGVDILVVREISGRPENFRRIFGQSLLFKSLSGVAVAGLAWALSFLPHVGPPARELLVPALVYSLFNSLLLHLRAAFRAFEVMQHEAVSIAVEKGLVMLACGVALAFRREALPYLVGMAVACGGALAWTALRLHRLRGLPDWNADAGTLWREVLRPALPFALMNLFTVIYFRSGSLMLKSLTGQDELVGHFNAGYRLIESYMLFPTIITAPIYPVLVRRLAGGEPVGHLVGKAARGVLGLTLLITIPVAFLRGPLTTLLFGPDFAPARDAVGLIALAMIPVGLTFVFGTLVAAAGRQGRANAWILAATLANLGLNAALIPIWGVEGAALTTILTEGLIMAGNIWVTRDLAFPGREAAR